MKAAEEIAELAYQARIDAGPLHARRREVRDLYRGDIVVPLSELYDNERAATANLLQQGLDGTAQRIASTSPDIRWHPKRAGFKEHEETARRKRQVSLGWHEANAMDLIRLRRARHITGYSESPVQVRWDKKRSIPQWNVRDPLGTFTAPMSRLDDMTPEWVTFCYTLPLGFIRRNYPDPWLMLNVGENRGDDVIVEIVEYVDSTETVLVAVGKKANSWEEYSNLPGGGHRGVTLERVPNPIGRSNVVVPGRIGLTEERRGQFDGMVPKYIRQARLDALQLIAIEDGIFPKQWLVARPNEIPKIVQIADPRRGQVGIVTGGVLDVQQLNPGYKTDQALANLERNQRIEGGVSASMTGEALSGARTARMADTVESGQVDFGVAEIQKILARSEQAELEIAAETAKAIGGPISISMYVSGKGSTGSITYQADTLFEECGVTVRYAMAGTDLNQQVVRVGQKMQLGLISDQTAREMDPEVADAELEKDRITVEGLEKAVLSGLEQQAATNPDFFVHLLAISDDVITNKYELVEAAIRDHKKTQEQQAAAAPPPGAPPDPNLQPGLAAPGAQPVAPLPPDLAALAGRLGPAVASPPQGAAA